MKEEPAAAVVLVERSDRRLLVVWNRRYVGWAMPGGKVEAGETIEGGAKRELLEETGLIAKRLAPIFDAPALGLLPKIDNGGAERGTHVYVFRAMELEPGVPIEREPGCPITWMTREEFLEVSPMSRFYTPMFATTPCEPLPFQPAPPPMISDEQFLDEMKRRRDDLVVRFNATMPYIIGRLTGQALAASREPMLVTIGRSAGLGVRELTCITCGKKVQTFETVISGESEVERWMRMPGEWFVRAEPDVYADVDEQRAIIAKEGYCSNDCLAVGDKKRRCRRAFEEWTRRRETYVPEAAAFDPDKTSVAAAKRQQLDAITTWRRGYDDAMRERMAKEFGEGWRLLLDEKDRGRP